MDASMSAPAAAPPTGQQQNLTNPPSQAYLLILTVALSLGLATPMVWIRFYVSLFVTKLFRWDDAFITLSWLIFIGYSTNALYSIKYGTLTSIWNIDMYTHIQWARILHAEELIYSVLIFTTKLSVLLLYKRIFVPNSGKRKWMSHMIWGIIVFNALFYTAKTFVVAFSCHPQQKIWDDRVTGSCVHVYAVLIGTAALNIVSDILVLAIPLTVIRKLRMPRKRKIEISLIFGFCVLGLISSIGRLVYGILGSKTIDQTMVLSQIMLWTFGEITACFLASCVPTLPLLRQHCQNQTQTNTTTRVHRHSNPISRSPSTTRTHIDADPTTNLISTHRPTNPIENSIYLPRHSWQTTTSTSGCPQIGALQHTWNDDVWKTNTWRDYPIPDEDPMFWADVHCELDGWDDGSSVTTFATRGTASTGIVVSRTVEIASVPKGVDGDVHVERKVGRGW